MGMIMGMSIRRSCKGERRGGVLYDMTTAGWGKKGGGWNTRPPKAWVTCTYLFTFTFTVLSY